MVVLYRKISYSFFGCVGLGRETNLLKSPLVMFFFNGRNSTVSHNPGFCFNKLRMPCEVRCSQPFLHIFGLFSPTWSWLSMGNPPRDFPGYLHQWMFFLSAIQSGHVSKMMIFGFLKKGKKGRESVTASSDYIICR